MEDHCNLFLYQKSLILWSDTRNRSCTLIRNLHVKTYARLPAQDGGSHRSDKAQHGSPPWRSCVFYNCDSTKQPRVARHRRPERLYTAAAGGVVSKGWWIPRERIRTPVEMESRSRTANALTQWPSLHNGAEWHFCTCSTLKTQNVANTDSHTHGDSPATVPI